MLTIMTRAYPSGASKWAFILVYKILISANTLAYYGGESKITKRFSSTLTPTPSALKQFRITLHFLIPEIQA